MLSPLSPLSPAGGDTGHLGGHWARPAVPCALPAAGDAARDAHGAVPGRGTWHWEHPGIQGTFPSLGRYQPGEARSQGRIPGRARAWLSPSSPRGQQRLAGSGHRRQRCALASFWGRDPFGVAPPDPAAPVPRDSHPSPLPFPAPPGCPHARRSWGRGPAGFLPAGPRLLCGRAGCPSGGRGHRGARGPCVSTATTFKTQRRGGRGGSGSRARRDVGAGAAAGARHPRGPAAAARPARQPAQGGRVLPQQLPAGQGTDRAG